MTEHTPTSPAEGGLNPALAGLLWLWVLIPFGYGVFQLVVKIPALFGS